MKIPEQLNKLAKHVAEKAIQDQTPFAEALDALGKLTTYYGLLLKNAGKSSEEDETAPTIGSMSERMREAEEEHVNGGTRIPAGPRRRA